MGRPVWEQPRQLMVGNVPCGVRTIGGGSSTVVLIHGIGTSSRYFAPLAAHLAREHTVHAIELPGFGSTPTPRHRLTIEELGSVVTGALRQLEVGSAVVVGHSMGCQVAAEVALAAPDLVERLVLLAPTVNNRERTAIRQGLRLGQDTLHESVAANLIVLTDYLRAGPRWYLRTLRSMLEHRLEEVLPRIACAVVIVRGARDPIVPADWVARLMDACPTTATEGVVPGEPHIMMFRSPEATARFCRIEEPDGAR